MGKIFEGPSIRIGNNRLTFAKMSSPSTRIVDGLLNYALFSSIWLRLTFLRTKNKILKKFRPKPAVLQNDPKIAEIMVRNLAQGNDKLNIGGATVRLKGFINNQHLNIITPTKLRTAVENSGLTGLKMGNPEATNIVMVARR